MNKFLESILIGLLALFLTFQRIFEVVVHFLVQKILDHLLSNNIVYNVAVEDPRQDKEILQIDNEDVIAMITTGSCNVLDRAIDNPKHIYAVDYNKNQNSLLELRLSCIKNLEYEEMWQIWGEQQDIEFFQKVYESRLKKDLSTEAKKFWDKNWKHLKNWHHYGSVGSTIKIFIKLFALFGVGDFYKVACDKNTTFEKQKQEWQKARPAFKRCCQVGWSIFHFVAPFLGVPPRQISIIEGNLMFDMFDHVFNNTHLATENYIIYAYTKGNYIKESCPRYLTPEGFATLKNNLKRNPDLISIHTAMFAEVLTKQVKDGELTVAILLDSMDWMEDEMVRSQLKLLKQKFHPKRGRLFFRSASSILTHPDLVSTLDYDTETVDKVKREINCLLGSYPGTFLGRFNNKESSQIANMPFPNNSLVDDLRVFKQMYFGKLSGTKEEQEKQLESFYKLQADKYDGYRQYMLHGRSAMISSIPLDQSNPIVWADFGCGTGSNFELIDKKYIKKIYGVDLCQSLLDVAKERVNRMKMNDQIQLIKADASKRIEQIKDESVDVVTFSYSLTMIPDWKASLQVALRILKPGGYLAVSDFTVNPNHSFYSNFFWKASFSRDYVNLNAEHKTHLQKIVEPKMYFVGEGGFPYIPLISCPYHVFLGQKRQN